MKGNRPAPLSPPQETTSWRESLGSWRIQADVHPNGPLHNRRRLAHVPNADAAARARRKDEKKPNNNRGLLACPINSPVCARASIRAEERRRVADLPVGAKARSVAGPWVATNRSPQASAGPVLIVIH